MSSDRMRGVHWSYQPLLHEENILLTHPLHAYIIEAPEIADDFD